MPWSCTHIRTVISIGPYKDDNIETYRCAKCNSEQDFLETGQTAGYSFIVGTYKLCFYTHNQTFKIKHYPQGRLGEHTVVLELNYLPYNLTPSTTTVDRIKTLITFS